MTIGTSLSEIARNIERQADGLWSAPSDAAISYPEQGNEYCFAVEDTSFWFRHRNNCILEIVNAFPPTGTFFDIGGGNGFVSSALQNTGLDVVLVEPGLTGARNARRRGIRHVIQSSLRDAQFMPGTLTCVGLFDVIEHIQDDHAFLNEIRTLVAPGGRVYLTVPAFRSLWSNEDLSAGHFRRYTLTSLTKLLRDTGFDVEFGTYIFSFLVGPILMLRTLPYHLGRQRALTAEAVSADHRLPNGLATRVYEIVTGREVARIRALKKSSIGGSCLVVARQV